MLDGTDGTIDAVYAGDLLGNLWRWDVSGAGTYPAPLRLAILTDGANPQPVTSRPLIEVHPSLKKRFVLVGTGRLLDNTDINSIQGQSFYAIADGTNARFNAAADLPSSVSFPITRAVLSLNATPLDLTKTLGYDPATQMGWAEDLGAGWRVTTDPTSLLGSVAWAATLPSVANVCIPSGNSHIYARDFGTASTTLRNTDNTALEYFSLGGNVTDLHYLSVDGKARLVGGTDLGGDPTLIPITAMSSLPLRRLNWRELQTVE
jgi:type IV pilus assembly protein PilY1